MIFGVGIDIVDVRRFKSAMDRKGLCERLFTPSELEYCMGQRSPEKHLAARFACKMSFFKAMGRRFKFREVEVKRGSSGRPEITAPVSGFKFNVTITHDNGLSLAHTIVEKVDEIS
ncbi:MAG: holo-ACP synthase [Deltaproteobacteria bacterium]|nr:holo-ACP synthase [Deltaproteobacteria bacterium]